MLKKGLFLVFLIVYCSYVEAQYINKSFLRYNRSGTIDYARDNWSRINPDYKNYGMYFIDPSGTTRGDCTTYGVHKDKKDCGGDCANFVSQCLLAGNISEFELTQNVNSNYVAGTQSHLTIGNALELRNGLVNMGAIDSISGSVTSTDLHPGDVIIVPQGGGYHALLVNQGVATHEDIQVYGHSPLSQAGISRRGLLSNWRSKASARLIHIPDVPCVRIVSIYKKGKGSQKTFNYDTYLDESKNGGDGEMPILERRIKQ